MMVKSIPRCDINGVTLHEGDIVAECQVGKSIWDGKAIVQRRPLGVVVVYQNESKAFAEPEETNCYNVIEIRTGLVLLTEEADPYMKTQLASDDRIMALHISRWDGRFCAWDDIEKVGSVYNLPD